MKTSDTFMLSSLSSINRPVDDSRLFDETTMIKINNSQKQRELWVKSRLYGEYYDFDDKKGHTNASSLPTKYVGSSSGAKARIEELKRQIKAVRRERKELLDSCVNQTQNYMAQLKQEHSIHAQEMAKLRNDDAEVSAYFLKEIGKLKSQYKHHKKPLDEIIAKVKSTIAESDLTEGQSISSIQVTEVNPDISSDSD